VKTGEVLLSVVANKKILSYGVDANAFRYVTFNRILQAEVGFTHNEPGTLAVEQAIEQAVLMFIVEGSARGLWAFQNRGFQSKIIEDYELSYLAVAQANAGTHPANRDNVRTASAANGKAAAPVKSASAPAEVQAAATNAAKPQQLAALNTGAGPQQQPAQEQPAPPFIVQPRTLEDEAPIAPR
jgi:curli production assembly/transport component CsgG